MDADKTLRHIKSFYAACENRNLELLKTLNRETTKIPCDVFNTMALKVVIQRDAALLTHIDFSIYELLETLAGDVNNLDYVLNFLRENNYKKVYLPVYIYNKTSTESRKIFKTYKFKFLK